MVIAVVVGFVVVVVIVIVHIYSNSPPKAGCDTRSSFSGIKLSFPSPRLVAEPKLKMPVYP